jgi:hypothetical protein
MISKYFVGILLFAILAMTYSTIGQTKVKVILTMKNSTFQYEGVSDTTSNSRFEIKQDGDSIVVSFSPHSRREGYLKWNVKRDTTARSEIKGIMERDELRGTFTVKDSQNFALKVLQDSVVYIEKGNLANIFAYSIMPGGGRFRAGRTWQGVVFGVLQAVPIPLAIHYNYQRLKYFDRSNEASKRSDRAGRDENFEKSKDYALRAGIALGCSGLLYLLNTIDVLRGVKDIKCQPIVYNDSFQLGISKKF